MAAQPRKAKQVSPTFTHASLPVVCVVRTDQQFLDELVPELIPWFQVVLRKNFVNLARCTREAHVVAVLLDFNTEAADAQRRQRR